MISFHITKTRTKPARRSPGWTIAVGAVAALQPGCAAPDRPLTPPVTVVAPYNTHAGDVLWAVVPLRNESGTTEADKAPITDKLVVAIEEVEGVRCLPLNRTLEAMRAIKLPAVQTPADAKRLAQAMGVDGIVVGSITNFDPYTPAIGLSLALFARSGPMVLGNRTGLDPYALESRPAETPGSSQSRPSDAPVAATSDNLDAKNNQVLMDVRQFAQGRDDGPSALGWRRYVASMELFSEFATHHSVARLIQAEWVRLAAGGSTPEDSPGGQP